MIAKPSRLIIVAFYLLFLVGCADRVAEIQSELDNNPKLKQKGIAVKVAGYKDGYVTLAVTQGLGLRSRKALNRGESLKDIYMFVSMDVDPLIEVEEILKRRSDVKAVMWTAE